MRNLRSISLPILPLVLLLAPLGPLYAADPAAVGSEGLGQGPFTFHLDPVAIEWLSLDQDTSSSKFQEYRDLDNGFRIPLLKLWGASADGNRTLDFSAKNVWRDDVRLDLDYAQAGKYGVSLSYDKIPHRFGNDASFLWSRTGAGRFEIDDALQRANQAAITAQFAANKALVAFPFLNNLISPQIAAAQKIDISLERERTRLDFDLGTLKGLSWDVSLFNEKRTGLRPYGASFGFSNATEIVEPIDYDTSEVTARGEWAGKNGGLVFGFRSSRFENSIKSVTWDNPFRATDSTDPGAYSAPGSGSINGPATGRNALAPDNKAGSFFLDGRWRFQAGWWANASASRTHMTQDEALLAYTTNTAINTRGGAPFDASLRSNLPQLTADRTANVTNFSANAGGKFAHNLGLTFRLRSYEYKDDSDRVTIPGYARFDAAWIPTARITVPPQFKRTDFGSELTWDVVPSTSLGLSWNRQTWDRKRREVEKTDEDVFKLTADSRAWKNVTLRAALEHGDKSIGHYDVEAAEDSFVISAGATNLPDLRKYDEAARTYDSWRVGADFVIGDAWTFTLATTGRKDDYDKSLFGLISDDTDHVDFELAYTPGPKQDIYLFGDRSNRKTFQKSRQSGALPSTSPLDDWQVKFDEINDVWGLGWNRKYSDRLKSTVEGRWSKSDGKADIFSPPGGTPNVAFGFDNYEDIELFSVSGKLDFTLNPHVGFGVWYLYEDYTIDSFIRQGLRNYLPGTLLLNADNGDYTANLFAGYVRLSL
jgi:MtrB/PioB family decaheme-associated outer membrane protein